MTQIKLLIFMEKRKSFPRNEYIVSQYRIKSKAHTQQRGNYKLQVFFSGRAGRVRCRVLQDKIRPEYKILARIYDD